MATTLLQVENDCRSYLNQQQISFLTRDILLATIHAAVLDLCNETRYPKAETNLTVPAGAAWVDASSLSLFDFIAVYYGSKAVRLDPITDEQADTLRGRTAASVEQSPFGYYYDEALKRIYLFTSGGEFAVVGATALIVRYSQVPPMLTDATAVMPIPDVTCYGIKYYVAHVYRERAQDQQGSLAQLSLWRGFTTRAIMRQPGGKRDVPKQIVDGLAGARKQYIDNY